MKHAKSLFIVFLSFINSSCYWNSNDFIINNGEKEFREILVIGTNKNQIIDFLKAKKYSYSDRNMDNYNFYNKDGSCARWSVGDLRWNCETYGYIFTRREAGVLDITDPHLRVHFFYDESNKLVKYHMGIGRTFL